MRDPLVDGTTYPKAKMTYGLSMDRWLLDNIGEDILEEDILAALRDSLPDGYVSWVDIKTQYKKIMSER